MPSETVVELAGEQALADWLDRLEDRVDAWLHEVVEEASEHAGARLIEHAPGSIKGLVGVDEPRPGDGGVLVEGEAHVSPSEITEPWGGAGSSPADYPYYVDAGTGVFGERGVPITSFPPGVMGPIEYGGRMIYIHSQRGQPAQRYSAAAARDTDDFLRMRVPTLVGKMLV